MQVGREGVDHACPGFGLRVGRVYDAERRFAARHQHQRGTHVFGAGEGLLDFVPHAQGGERSLGVLADRHRIRIGQCQAPAFECRSEAEAGRNRQLDVAVRRGHQDKHIEQQVLARTGDDQVLLRHIVHPLLVGGEEQVGRRTVLDLFGQRVAAGIGNSHLMSGFRGERLDVLVERLLQAGSGKDGDVGGESDWAEYAQEAEREGFEEVAHFRTN